MPHSLLVFILDEHRYALPLAAVERVVRAVEVTPLPKAPGIVLGLINAEGRIIPVVNIRRRFHLPEREVSAAAQFILAATSRRTVALVVETVTGIVECREAEFVAAERILLGTDYVQGLLKLEDGMVLIHDLETFLSLEEEQALDAAMPTA